MPSKSFFTRSTLTLVALCATAVAVAQGPVDIDRSRPQITRAQAGQPLTAASHAAPEAVVNSYLLSRGRPADVIASLRTTQTVAGAGGVTHLRIAQEIDGLAVRGAYARAAISSRGELVQMIDRLAAVSMPAPSRIDALQALESTMTRLYPSESATFRPAGVRGNTTAYDGGAFFYRAPTVEAVVIPLENGTLAKGWLVETWTADKNVLNHTTVDGNGNVLDVELRTASDSYNVFAEDPLKGAQTVVSGPGAGNAESPAGWLGTAAQATINISGNNVSAYLDADANNAPDSGGSAVTDGNFLTAVDLAAQPSTVGNKAVAVQNLFYLNNVIHDVLYRHGFNEANGNFQVDNFGKGGTGNDPVKAEAQDGGGTDNANFSTPNDGSSPRMQMYLWTGSAPDAYVNVSGTNYAAYGASFGPALTSTGKSGALAAYVDGTAPSGDGCEAATVSLTGKIAVVDRGTCNFTVKVLNAQNAGAVGVIVANNSGTNEAFTMGGTERRVKIPSVMVGKQDGAVLKGRAGTTAVLKKSGLVALQLDGDLDADIVFHEYGHGLTWRMIGGMSGPLAGAIGEGASDVVAFLVNGDDVVGEYAYSNPLGIRRYPYTNYPLTYSAVTGAEVHNDGEIYAGAMWRVLQNYLAAGLTADDLMGDFVDGMNYTPSTPAFENMRDGMLQSVAGSGRECLIWRGFANRGIGVGAKATVSRRGAVTITESFAVPASCQ